MKAKINGIEIEGTPEEMKEFLKQMGVAEQAVEKRKDALKDLDDRLSKLKEYQPAPFPEWSPVNPYDKKFTLGWPLSAPPTCISDGSQSSQPKPPPVPSPDFWAPPKNVPAFADHSVEILKEYNGYKYIWNPISEKWVNEGRLK